MVRCVAMGVGLCFILSAASGRAQDRSHRKGFVYAERGALLLDGAPYRFAGTNSYRMLDSTAAAEEHLLAARSLGLNTLRMWGFANGQAPQDRRSCLVFNVAPGQWPARLEYPEEAWRRLDYVVQRAGALGIRLILPLGNYWDEFGGIELLARWAGLPPEETPFRDREEFYRAERTRELYAAYVERMMTRVNHLTGVAYRDDPAILMWEPLNEARGRSDVSGRTVAAWLEWAASLIKRYDPDHLVGSGTEGFFASYAPGPGDLPAFDYDQYPFQASRSSVGRRLNPATQEWEEDTLVPEGAYFPDDCALPHIDACSVHAWPYNWFAVDRQSPELFVQAWLEAHTKVMRDRSIDKALYVGEFGLQVARAQATAVQSRDRVFSSAFQVVLQKNVAGAAFWHLSLARPEQLWTGLTFDVLCPPGHTGDSTCQVVRSFSDALAERLGP